MTVDIIPSIEEVDTDNVDAIIRNNNYKLTADKIKQILNKILNDPTQSSKRWIWELMQNAKDVKNRFGEVSVEIELSDDELVFRHNGNPFKIANITGLIQQVSSKDSANTDESVTGKFGTGFIATHLLSEIISVIGIVEHKQVCRSFDVVLDRRGRTSEDLLPKIKIALEKIRMIETDPVFPIVENYDIQRSESDFDTKFVYPLADDEKKKAAKDGIADLQNTLPLTLVNIPKIKSVKIIDRTTLVEAKYKSKIESDDGKVRKTSIKLTEEDTRCFITYYNDELSISIEVNNFDELCLLEHFGKVPNLYRDFPLIGSDKFYFPYIFNGFHFHPTDDRDGIPIHSESAPDHIENRVLVEKAFQAAKEFTKYLITQGAQNLYVCAFSRLPNEKWQEFSKKWAENLQKDYRTFLNGMTVVETAASTKVMLNEVYIPFYGDTDEIKLQFYDIIESFIGKNALPDKDILLKWIKVSGPKEELESWGRDLRYDLDRLLTEIDKLKNIEALSKKLAPGTEPIQWLNSLYQFVIDNKETDSFSGYAVIPNQQGDFQKLSPDTLHLEDTEANIPDEFLDVLVELGDDWRIKLIHRSVILAGQNIEKKGLPLASNRINDLITKDDFRKKINYFKIIRDIIRNVTSVENVENYRCEIFLKGKELFGFEENIRVVSNIKDFRFKNALDIFIETINTKIQECITVTGLVAQLKFQKNETITWLNGYLNILIGNKELANQVCYGNIVPNRNESLCAYEDLYNYGTPEYPLNSELIEILAKLNPVQEWNKILVMEGVNVGRTPKTFTDLGAAVDTAIKEIEKEEAVNLGYINDYKDTIIELINWCNSNYPLNGHLSHFMNRKNDLWVKFSMTDKMFKLLRDKEAIATLEAIQESGISTEDIRKLIELFPNGIPANVIEYAKEAARKKKEFYNLLEVGSKVEKIFVKTLEQFEITSNKEDIIHAGGGAYDIRIYNPLTKKSFYIEIKSCRYQNSDPINIAVSQVKKAVKEIDNGTFGIVIIERTQNNVIDEEYIKANTKYLKNPGQYLGEICSNYEIIERSANTNDIVDLKMINAEFKGSMEYSWALEKVGNNGFIELLNDIVLAIN